ncbi:MAG: hypothetical protein MJZ68_03735 [archaeon]|nr:hypothetical protein [archaeon]
MAIELPDRFEDLESDVIEFNDGGGCRSTIGSIVVGVGVVTLLGSVVASVVADVPSYTFAAGLGACVTCSVVGGLLINSEAGPVREWVSPLRGKIGLGRSRAMDFCEGSSH